MFNPDPKKYKKEKKKRTCSVIGCFIQPSRGNFCKGHHDAIFNKDKKGMLEARLDNKLAKTRKLSKPKSPFWRAVANCDTAFSKYVRLYYSDKNGYVSCVTCGAIYFWTHPKRHLHCGHFEDRGRMLTRWDLKNCGPQCIGCNSFKEGRKHIFSKFISDYWGEDVPDKLTAKSVGTSNWSIPEIKEMTKFFNKEVRRLRKEKNI